MLNARRMPLWTVLPLSFLAACGSGKDAPDAKGKGGKRTPRFAAVEMSLQAFSAPHAVLGAVRASEGVEIRTEVAGRLSALPFAEGAPVRKGQVLARLDDAEARASRDRSAARSRLADATLARVREQWKAEAASAQQVEVAAADSAVARAELALAEVALARTVVVAPFDGIAGLREHSPGQWIPAGTLLVRVVARRSQLEASLAGSAAGLARVGQKLTWNDPSGRAKGRAEVSVLDAWVDPSTRARRLRATCLSGCEGLLPGAAVRMEFGADSTKVLAVPSTALAGDAKGLGLFVHRGGKAVFTPVEIGRRTADRLEILSGVAVGDTVLIPGATPPRPGSDVEVARLLGGPRR